MKLDWVHVLFFSFLFYSALSSANEMAVPQKLLDRHVKSCPDFEKWKLFHDGYNLPLNGDKEQKRIFVMGCTFFAYNTLEKAYILDSKDNILDVWVPEIDYKGDWNATSDLMGADFDDVTRTLTTFQKGRGLGDCGSSAVYYYDHNDEKFIMIEARLKMHCDGDTETQWPVVYKKK